MHNHNHNNNHNRGPPPLPRPLGLPQLPRKHTKVSLRERAERMMDKDAKIAERRHIIKQVGKGYFGDYNKLRHEGGKMWVAPKTLIQEKVGRFGSLIVYSSLSHAVADSCELLYRRAMAPHDHTRPLSTFQRWREGA